LNPPAALQFLPCAAGFLPDHQRDRYEKALADCEASLKHRPNFALPQSRIKEIHAKMASEA
jgi:hypothetical protein